MKSSSASLLASEPIATVPPWQSNTHDFALCYDDKQHRRLAFERAPKKEQLRRDRIRRTPGNIGGMQTSGDAAGSIPR